MSVCTQKSIPLIAAAQLLQSEAKRLSLFLDIIPASAIDAHCAPKQDVLLEISTMQHITTADVLLRHGLRTRRLEPTTTGATCLLLQHSTGSGQDVQPGGGETADNTEKYLCTLFNAPAAISGIVNR